jgi:hypothetical protein
MVRRQLRRARQPGATPTREPLWDTPTLCECGMRTADTRSAALWETTRALTILPGCASTRGRGARCFFFYTDIGAHFVLAQSCHPAHFRRPAGERTRSLCRRLARTNSTRSGPRRAVATWRLPTCCRRGRAAPGAAAAHDRHAPRRSRTSGARRGSGKNALSDRSMTTMPARQYW